ncbi:DUF6712 family protein [Chitinophaga rhizosphaerae]|uniref:DUF6712 family protein n=1 Tax=Chitinophaga rhizosphaerae TaxID=1864947 RepID=UPI000F80A991|nr:DUF6712 family protein [Chitinophaga rhizosphaerae]
MSLLRSTADLKKYVDIHKATSWESLRLYVVQAEATYIIPVISQACFEQMAGVVALPDFDPETSFPTVVMKGLYTRVCFALANYTLYEALPFLNTPVGDQGVMQQSSKEGTAAPAAQWRFDNRRNSHLEVGDRHIEMVLEFLENNDDAFPDWKASSSYSITKDLIISSSAALGGILNTQGARRAYLAMRPFLRLAEKKFIVPALGEPLFLAVKAELLAGVLSPPNQRLFPYVAEAAAWTALVEALPILPFRITGDGLLMLSKSDGIASTSHGSDNQRSLAFNSAKGNADSFLAALKSFLVKNKNDYPQSLPNEVVPQPEYELKRNKKCSGHFRV